MHESEKWKWSRSVVYDPQWPHGLQPSRVLHPWNFPGKSTGVGCHFLLQWKALREMENQTILPFSWETCMQVQEATVRTCMEQLIGSRWRKEYSCLLSPCLFHLYTEHIMRNCWAGWVTSQNWDRWEKHEQTQISGWYHSNGRKQRGTKELLDTGEGGEWKSRLKTKYLKKLRSQHLAPLLHGK